MTREAELLIDMWDTLHRECHKVVTEENYDVIKKVIKALEQEPRKGHWEPGKELCKEYRGKIVVDVTYADWHCSNCNYVIKGTVKPKWNYCPNCVSKMVEPQESEDQE